MSTTSSGDRRMAAVAIAMALGVLWTAPLGCLAQTNSYTGPEDYTKYSTQHQYTFPTKSVNLTHASSPSFYHLFGPEVNSESNRETRLTAATCGDHHPVHGTQASDGTYLITGKCITNPESESASAKVRATKETHGDVFSRVSSSPGTLLESQTAEHDILERRAAKLRDQHLQRSAQCEV